MDPIFPKYDENILDRFNQSLQFAIALQLLERWAMIAADVDGEDSSGRQKIRMLTPKEMVKRAFDTANALVERELRSMGGRRYCFRSPDSVAY